MRRFVLLALLAAACQTDPVTGKVYYSPLDNDFASQDRFIRENFLTEVQVANDGGILPEPEIADACAKIFARVARAVPEEHRRGFRYYFFLSASPQVNAYTYGGGRVHCHLGLLARCGDASEFAAVIAHEIGHLSHDHIGQRLGRSSVTGRLAGLGGIAGPPGRKLVEALGGVVLVQYTRAQEREADDRSVDYLAAAGLDPDGAARFFESMDREFGSGGAELFQTHPHPDNRVKRIRGRIAKRGAGAGGDRDDPEFRSALERARFVLAYYEALYAAAAGDDYDLLADVAAAGIDALPHHPQFHFWKGIAHAARKEAGPALASLRIASALDRTNVLLPFVLATVEFGESNWAEAEEAASKTLAIIPTIGGAYLIRGIARAKLGRTEDGYRDLDLVMRSVPSREREGLLAEIRKQVPDYAYPR